MPRVVVEGRRHRLDSQGDSRQGERSLIKSASTFSRQGLKRRRERLGVYLVRWCLMRRTVAMSMQGDLFSSLNDSVFFVILVLVFFPVQFWIIMRTFEWIRKLKGPNHNFRDSADVGDGGAGIGPVTYTPFPDPPVSSPGEILHKLCADHYFGGIWRKHAFKIYVENTKGSTQTRV